MRVPNRPPGWRVASLAAVALVAGSLTASARSAPVLSPVIVQASSAPVARTAVESVIALSGGIGKVVADLPLVNGVSASLTSAEVAQLTSYVVTPDATVLTAGFSTKGTPAPAPRQLDDVFPTVTGATRVIAAGNSGQGIGVAVLDTGIANLADFSGRLRTGVDLSGEGNAQSDGYGHGTFVAGLVAGNGASSKGTYVGEAPGATLVPVKVAGKSGATTMSKVIQGLQWVKANTTDNIRVVNMSIGAIPKGSTFFNPLDQAVESMWRSGYVIVTSAGNNGPAVGTITSPGDDPLVITVGAVDTKDTVTPDDDALPSFSSHGPTAWDAWWKPDLLAPGKSVVSVTSTTSAVWSANPSARVGSKNFVGSGTSFATAITSGAAAMLLHENPSATPDNVKAALLTTTNAGPSPPQDPFAQGHGVLDVGRAVDEPVVSMTQDVSAIVPPTVLGTPIPLLSRQVVSTWASGSASDQLLYPAAYPFPYSGPATTSTDGTAPLFHTSAWNSGEWNTSAWNTSAWKSSAWNTSAWNTSAWNSSAWNTSAWN